MYKMRTLPKRLHACIECNAFNGCIDDMIDDAVMYNKVKKTEAEVTCYGEFVC